MGWKDKGRYVRKGEKAITLCQPVTVKRRRDEEDEGDEQVFTRFVYKPHWFVLAQTEGQELPAGDATDMGPRASTRRARHHRSAVRSPRRQLPGFARQRSISVSPVAPLPHKTAFHELAHVLLGHTTEGEQHDGDITPRSLREVEAECVAMLCCAALDLPGVSESRGYVQHWGGAGNPIPERSAQRILKAADQILKAGTSTPADGEASIVRATPTARAIAYLRVSTDLQAESGLGLEAQEAAVRSAASRLRLDVVRVFVDAGTSGKLAIEDRPVLLEAVAVLRRGDVLLVGETRPPWA